MACVLSRRALCAALLVATAAAQEKPRTSTGADVTLRGAVQLDVALKRAVASAFKDGKRTGTATFVFDVTPYVRENVALIEDAFRALQKEFGADGEWRLARLGEKARPRRADPGELVEDLAHAFECDDLVRIDTFRSLRTSLTGVPGPGVVVYLADWNSEDESELEPFIADLKKRGLRLHVVGGEGCFGRAWIDGFFPPDRGVLRKDNTYGLYDVGVGRAPFGPFAADAPQRSGDTAWTQVPFYWNGAYWNTTFAVQLASLPPKKKDDYGRKDRRGGETGDAEDLRERTAEVSTTALETYWYPLPSSFGPYALSRAAAETGGRYVLWSWNRTGRTTLLYDDVRCDLFAPDLRDRETIRADAAKRPLPRAIIKAWWEIANKDVMVARATPPLSTQGKPQETQEPPPDAFLSYGWSTAADRTNMIARARTAISALDRAIAVLDAALKSGGASTDPVDRRYAADADLLRHTLLVHRFTIGEALIVAESDVPADAWKDPKLQPGLSAEIAVMGGESPETALIPDGAPVRNRALCERVRDDRRRFLEKYAGTPFGALVGKNRVSTVVFTKTPYGSGVPGRTSPADSDARRGRTGPGSAPGQGGTTGK